MNNGENPFILLPSIKDSSAAENRTQRKLKGHYKSDSHMIRSKRTIGNDVGIRNRSQEAIPCFAKYTGEYRFPSRYKTHEDSKRKLSSNNNKRYVKIKEDNVHIFQSQMSQKSAISTRPKLPTQFMTIDDYHFSNINIINTRKTEQQLKCRIKSKILKFKSLLKIEQRIMANEDGVQQLAKFVNVKCFDHKTHEHSTAYQTGIQKSHLRLKREQRKPPIFRLNRNTQGNQSQCQKLTSIEGWNFQQDDFQ